MVDVFVVRACGDILYFKVYIDSQKLPVAID